MKCPSCNKETNDNGKFCTFCGAKLPTFKYCPKCGAKLNPDKKFCEKCGAPNDSYSQPQVSYPVFSQTGDPDIVNRDPNQQDSEFPIGGAIETGSSALKKSDIKSEVTASGLTPNESNLTDSNIDQLLHKEDDSIPEDTDSEDLPVYEELGNEHSATRNIVLAIVMILLAGGVLLLGQRLNWWHIGALSWVGGDHVSSEVVEFSEAIIDEESEMGDESTSVTSSEEYEKTPFSMSLDGYIDGKYGVEMFISGYKTSDGIYPESGKYRYTKYKGAWIDLHFVVEKADYFKMYEYTDGNLTGTWDVHFDGKSDSIIGYMTNNKGDTYPVKLNATFQDSLDVYDKFKESIPTFKDIYLSFLGHKKINYEELGFSKTVKSRMVGDNDDIYQIDDIFYRLELDSEHYCEISSISYMEANGYTFKIVGFPDLMDKYCEEAKSLKSSPDFSKYCSEIYIKKNEIEWGVGDGY